MTILEYQERPIVESLANNMRKILKSSKLDDVILILELSLEDKEYLVRSVSRDIIPSDVVGVYFSERNSKAEEILVFAIDGMFVKCLRKPVEFYSYSLTKELSLKDEERRILFTNNIGEQQILPLRHYNSKAITCLFRELQKGAYYSTPSSSIIPALSAIP